MYKLISLLAGLGLTLGVVAQLGHLDAVSTQGTCPISSPATYFVAGKVVYKKRDGTTLPGTNVQIKALSRSNSYTCVTGTSGQYALEVVEDRYIVSASDMLKTRFDPRSYKLNVNGQIFGKDFTGKIN